MTNEAIYEILIKQNTEETQALINDGLNLSTLNLAEVMVDILNKKIDFSQDYLRFLIKNGIDIDSSTKAGYTPLMIAIIAELDEIKYLLLEKGVDIHKTTEEGMSAILWAVAYGDYNLVKALTSRGGDIHQTIEVEVVCDQDTDGIPIIDSELKKIKVILSAFALAFNKYNKNIVRFLLELGFDPNEKVLRKGNIFNLTKKSPSLYILDDTAIYNVIKESDTETLNLLIEKGVDVNIDFLIRACNLFPLCLEREEDREDQYCGVINLDIISLLIEKGADVNYFNEYDGASLLMEAVSRLDGFDIVKILIEKGADVNAKDNKRNSCLHKCFHINAEKVMHLLIQNGADVNAKNNIGMTPLMHYAFKGDDKLVKILLENGANINAKSEMTAFDLASDEKIKEMIQSKKNNHPQKLVKLLSNFTIDKPIKYTTHEWDFGELQKEYGNFEGYMSAIKKQFDDMKNELETLSPNLCKKVYTFLLETEPSNEYSWCSKTQINLGWSSLKGLKEWCDSGKNPFAFKLPKAIFIGRKQIATFGEVITLFKGEIEVRTDTKAFNLESIFSNAFVNFKVDYSTSKLATRQFYTDTQKFSAVLSQIAKQMHMREDCNSLEVSSMELEDRSIEIKLTQIGSYATQNSQGMLEEVKDGDFADIKANLTNLCDWSIESGFESDYFRINYLHSNNVKEIVLLNEKPKGFTHIFRFYR